MKQFLLCSLKLSLIIICIASASAMDKKRVNLATTEREPYVGKDLPNHGYVAELVTAAFEREGYEVNIKFYPLARAVRLAKKGNVDGLLPSYFNKEEEKYFVFSTPFPGDKIGLLKRKSLSVSFSADPRTNFSQAMQGLTKLHIGLIRGSTVSQEFDEASYLIKDLVNTDSQNIEKLEFNRVQLAVIDKFTAADLMVNQHPHMIGKLEFMQPYLAENDFHIAFSKNIEKFLQLKTDFDSGLVKLKKEGTLEKILNKHGLFHSKNPDGGKKNLVIGAIETDEITMMKALSKTYQKKHKDVELEWRILDENTLRKRLLADLAISDGQFDIMMIGAYETQIWSKNNWLKPLRNLPGSYDLDDIVQSVRDGLRYKDDLFALPFYAESTMTFYRKDLFTEAGISMPEAPTYEDILKLAERVHKPNAGIYGIGLRGKPGWGQNIAFITTLVNTFGGRWFDEKWRPQLTSTAWKNALFYYKDILTRFGPPNSAENGWYENQKLFAKGKLAILIDATSLAGRLYNPKTSKVYDKVGFATAPSGGFPAGARWLWSWSLAIPASSKLSTEALDFITWASSKDYIKQVANTEGWVAVPPGSRLSTYGEAYNAAAPFANFVIEEIQKADPVNFNANAVPYTGPQFVAIPEFPALGHQVGLKVAAFLKGKLSLEQVLAESQELVDIQMRRFGYY